MGITIHCNPEIDPNHCGIENYQSSRKSQNGSGGSMGDNSSFQSRSASQGRSSYYSGDPGHTLCRAKIFGQNRTSLTYRRQSCFLGHDKEIESNLYVGQAANRYWRGSLLVYFPEDSSQLGYNDEAAIGNYLSDCLNVSSIQVTGYADVCLNETESTAYNQKLSLDRAQNTAQEIKGRSSSRTPVQASAEGDQYSRRHDDEHRVVEVKAHKTKFAQFVESLELKTPDKEPVDYVLVDVSGSMSLGQVKSHKFYRDTKVYFAIDPRHYQTGLCEQGGMSLQSVQQGGTYIYAALSRLIDKIPDGSSVAVWSDFVDSSYVAKRAVEKATAEARNRNIAIYYGSP